MVVRVAGRERGQLGLQVFTLASRGGGPGLLKILPQDQAALGELGQGGAVLMDLGVQPLHREEVDLHPLGQGTHVLVAEGRELALLLQELGLRHLEVLGQHRGRVPDAVLARFQGVGDEALGQVVDDGGDLLGVPAPEADRERIRPSPPTGLGNAYGGGAPQAGQEPLERRRGLTLRVALEETELVDHSLQAAPAQDLLPDGRDGLGDPVVDDGGHVLVRQRLGLEHDDGLGLVHDRLAENDSCSHRRGHERRRQRPPLLAVRHLDVRSNVEEEPPRGGGPGPVHATGRAPLTSGTSPRP